jgi:Transmembrane family 220, helix
MRPNIHVILALIFLFFALLQLNDPDPYIWIPIYGAVAAVCLLNSQKKYYPPLILAIMGGLSIYWMSYMPHFIDWIQSRMPSIVGTMKAETPFVEFIREFFGLLLAILTLAYELRVANKAGLN